MASWMRALRQRIIRPPRFHFRVLSRHYRATLRARPTVPVNNNMTGYGVKQMNSNSTGLSSRFAGLHAQASLSTLAADEMSDAPLIERIPAARRKGNAALLRTPLPDLLSPGLPQPAFDAVGGGHRERRVSRGLVQGRQLPRA